MTAFHPPEIAAFFSIAAFHLTAPLQETNSTSLANCLGMFQECLGMHCFFLMLTVFKILLQLV